MSLAAGTRLGPYEITEQIGIGGMGEVYRARDVNLGRDVAIKVLPEAFAQDADRLARFEREARTLASLSHPNVATVHGFEKADAVRALVMEFVGGPTLADRIAQGPIPIDEALPIARQIAEAVEAAHEQGIIHRDLKPANIKVRDDGTVKVLDFGLAKMYGPPEGGPYVPNGGAGLSRPSESMSPTITTPAMTQLGMILGTAAYMAPEQARGKALDKRTDIWAFGCVLFEMLTGTRAFDGEDATDTIAAVVRAEPKWDALPADVPPPIRLLLRRCLEKDRKKRIGDISTALFIISEPSAMASSSPAAAVASVPRRAKWRRAAWYALTAILASILTAAVVWGVTRPAAPRVSRLEMTTSGASALALSQNTPHVAITRDGSRIIYVGGPAATTAGSGVRLFVRDIDQLDSRALVENGALAFVSPDSEWIGFFSQGSLRKVSITGGPSIELTRVDNTPRGGTWAPDDTIIFATTSPTTGLRQVSSAGGNPIVLTRPDRTKGEGPHIRPSMLPGGRGVLFTITSATGVADSASSQIAVLDLRTPGAMPRTLIRGGSDARYLQSGHLVYVADNSLRAVRFNLSRLDIQGSAVPVLPSLATVGGIVGEYDVSDDGTLVYLASGLSANNAGRTLTWVNRQGKEEPIPAPPKVYLYPRISPDGTRVAVDVREQENDIWVWDLARRNMTRVTKDPGLDRTPVWAADGEYLYFSSTRDGSALVYRQRADGTGAAERMTETGNGPNQFPLSLSPEGTQLIVEVAAGGTASAERDLMSLRVDSPQASSTRALQPLVKTANGEANGAISPDGRWLAYQSSESGNWDIYVQSVRDLEHGVRSTVSTAGGTQPRWAPNGRELFYLSPRNEMMRVSVGNGDRWSSGTPEKIFDAGAYFTGGQGNPYFNYDIAKDGRFLMIKPVAGTTPEGNTTANLIVVQHWFEELKRLVPAK